MSQLAETLCRRLEVGLQASVMASSISIPPVYCWGEDVERTLPCGVIECRATGEDMGILVGSSYGTEAELRIHAIVAGANANASAQAVEVLSAALVSAVETASLSGFTYVRIERTGEERTFEDARRHLIAIYKATII